MQKINKESCFEGKIENRKIFFLQKLKINILMKTLNKLKEEISRGYYILIINMNKKRTR